MSKCPRAASSQCPQLWSPHAGLQHLCGQKPPTPGAGTPAEHLERAESFCPLGCIQPVPSVQGLLSYQLFLGSGRTLLEVFLPQAGVKPAFPFLTQAGSPLRATVMLLACPLRPLRSQDALAPPPKASEKLQIRCDLNLVGGASLFTVKENKKQKTKNNDTLYPLHMHKTQESVLGTHSTLFSGHWDSAPGCFRD